MDFAPKRSISFFNMRSNTRYNGILGITPQQPSKEILSPPNPSSHLASWESHASSSPAGKISRLHALLRTICLRITAEIHSHMKLQILHFAVYVVVTVIRWGEKCMYELNDEILILI